MNIIKAVKYLEKHPKSVIVNKKDNELYLCITWQVFIKRKDESKNINHGYLSPLDIKSKWIIKKDVNLNEYLK